MILVKLLFYLWLIFILLFNFALFIKPYILVLINRFYIFNGFPFIIPSFFDILKMCSIYFIFKQKLWAIYVFVLAAYVTLVFRVMLGLRLEYFAFFMIEFGILLIIINLGGKKKLINRFA